jgi:hypothetical protein
MIYTPASRDATLVTAVGGRVPRVGPKEREARRNQLMGHAMLQEQITPVDKLLGLSTVANLPES